jgi:septal ring factor EnvC (AmiA/AmiB activator)
MTSGLLEAAPVTPVYVEAPPVGPSRRRGWGVFLVVLVVLAAVGLVVDNEVQTDHRFDRTQQSLDTTRNQLDLARADLTQLRQDLHVVEGQVNRSQTALNIDFAQLLQTQVALRKSEGTVASQSASISTLQTCLQGITGALNALSVGDQHTAIAALDAVSSSCQSAVVADG